ncbi:MAG: alpha/beta hydrolase [Gammaproteobacteria bacterium]|nr:alpha/beta hydrolase [Gammaproteobacteria bacterium]
MTNAAPLAELVRIFTPDRNLLHGLLWEPAGQARALVLYVPGLTGTFCSPQDMGSFAKPVVGAGYALLAINLRVAGPPGLPYSRFEDCVPDLDAALKFATARGHERIVLLGDSLGGPRSCYFWQERRPAQVCALVLMASIPSPYEEAQQRWNEAERMRFDTHLGKMRGMISAGKGQELEFYPDFQPRRGIALSAATWVNTFGTPAECNASTLKYLPQVTVPVLVLHGSRDTISLPENARTMYEAATLAPRRDLAWADADHFFFAPPEAIAYATRLREWLDSVLPPA